MAGFLSVSPVNISSLQGALQNCLSDDNDYVS